jgi:hypothetical protein
MNNSDVIVAAIAAVPGAIAAIAAILAARSGRVTVIQGRRAEDKASVAAANSEVAATQSSIAAEQTAQISNGMGDNLSDQLDTILKTQDEVVHMLHDHITDPKLHRK